MLAGRFWDAVTQAGQRVGLSDPPPLPSRLAWAAAHVLNADGAGVSASAGGDLRVPLGASSAQAQTTEQLQFTTGEGPCLTAWTQQDMVMATDEVIAHSWPIFARQLQLRTSYRSVFAAPLHGIGVLDLLYTHPHGCGNVSVADVREVTGLILSALHHDDLPNDHHPAWTTPTAMRRHDVSIAAGVLTHALRVEHHDAVAIIRGHAFLTNQDVEDVAAALITGHLSPTQFR